MADSSKHSVYGGKYLPVIEGSLDSLLPKENERSSILHQAMRYSVFSGGKRLRPILCLMAAKLVAPDFSNAIIPACALELFHTFTLIHDDLPCMDNDDYRRGKLTCHKKFGEAIAILAGDALLALAFEIVASVKSVKYSSGDFVKELAITAGSRGVGGGQAEDILLARQNCACDRAMLDFIHLHKTADLFKTALKFGAMAADASFEQVNALSEFGTKLGLAFQLRDDILDEGKKEASVLRVLEKQDVVKSIREHITDAIKFLTLFDDIDADIVPLKSIAEFVVEEI